MPCGIIISPCAPWMAVSPDRKIYNPNMSPPFGLLEIKCPQVTSVLERDYLVKDDKDELQLKRNHEYYTQIQMQLAVTGLKWCDFFVWCENDHHLETIAFDMNFWQLVKDKSDKFYFEYFLSC